MIIENKPGAASIIGVNTLATSPADGQTLMVDGGAALTTLPSVANLPFNPEKDIAGVGAIAQSPTILVARADLPANNLKELVARAKASPGALTVGLSAPGTLRHFVMALLKQDANIEMLDVPYKGSAPAMQALLSGEVDLVAADLSAVLPNLKSGRLKCLATLSTQRIPEIPEIPTSVEQGFPKLIAMNYYGLFAPGGMNAQLVERIGLSLIQVVMHPDVVNRMKTMNMSPAPMRPSTYQALLRSEREKWSPIGKATGTRIN
jgi:tripartite-type tricarboxylate transporter receptor subunit TctC